MRKTWEDVFSGGEMQRMGLAKYSIINLPLPFWMSGE